MSRYYDFVYRKPDGGLVTVRGCGNTKTSAERWARYTLKNDHGLNPAECVRMSTSYVPEDKR